MADQCSISLAESVGLSAGVSKVSKHRPAIPQEWLQPADPQAAEAPSTQPYSAPPDAQAPSNTANSAPSGVDSTPAGLLTVRTRLARPEAPSPQPLSAAAPAPAEPPSGDVPAPSVPDGRQTPFAQLSTDQPSITRHGSVDAASQTETVAAAGAAFRLNPNPAYSTPASMYAPAGQAPDPHPNSPRDRQAAPHSAAMQALEALIPPPFEVSDLEPDASGSATAVFQYTSGRLSSLDSTLELTPISEDDYSGYLATIGDRLPSVDSALDLDPILESYPSLQSAGAAAVGRADDRSAYPLAGQPTAAGSGGEQILGTDSDLSSMQLAAPGQEPGPQSESFQSGSTSAAQGRDHSQPTFATGASSLQFDTANITEGFRQPAAQTPPVHAAYAQALNGAGYRGGSAPAESAQPPGAPIAAAPFTTPLEDTTLAGGKGLHGVPQLAPLSAQLQRLLPISLHGKQHRVT